MLIHELSALGAATMWAIGGLISSKPSSYLGAVHFSRWRSTLVCIMLSCAAFLTGGWGELNLSHLPLLVASGAIGIFLGDTLLFLTLNRMGPRRTSILFAMNAPMSVLLGWVFLSETLNLPTLVGVFLASVGVGLAIVFGKRASQLHHWESIKGPVWAGVLLGLGAALCQSFGSLIARPVMAEGIDPVLASAVRLLTSAVLLTLFVQLPFRFLEPLNRPNVPILFKTALSGFVGMGLGVTLLLFALSGGKVGVVAALSATSPVIMLPILWWRTKERPALAAWLGALLACGGTALIFLN